MLSIESEQHVILGSELFEGQNKKSVTVGLKKILSLQISYYIWLVASKHRSDWTRW